MRTLAPETTLLYARSLAAIAGISEVSDITGLDVLGVPVCVSVRPQARGESYTFGKGLRLVEAEVGAYMEALEFFFAEPGHGIVTTRWGSARDVAGAERAHDAILDFAPLVNRKVDLDAPLLLASAEDVESRDERSIPAELVYYPASDVGQSLFGTSTNGLASGNSVMEASLQALLELIERDIWSFESVRSSSRLVDPASLPDKVRKVVERAEQNGLELRVRTVLDDYGLPFFAAFVFDSSSPSRKTFNGGWACDVDREVALVRAVTEAAQSRVAFIHGGRRVPALQVAEPEAHEIELLRRHMRGVSDARKTISFNEIPDPDRVDSLEKQFDLVIKCLRRVVTKPIYRVVLTPKNSPLQIVRLVVPLLESFKENRVRVGRRLKAAIDAVSAEAA